MYVLVFHIASSKVRKFVLNAMLKTTIYRVRARTFAAKEGKVAALCCLKIDQLVSLPVLCEHKYKTPL